ncbi:MAG: hypothetical protein VXY34_01585 [Bdellovibrionota bacterium]|nr:hypothetical protein [Bdellovibrionota bacterium]
MEKLLINRIKSEFSIIPENGLKIEVSFKGKGTKKMKGISKIKKSNGRTYVSVHPENRKPILVKTNIISLIIFLESLGLIEDLEVSFSFIGVSGSKSTFTIFQNEK